MHSYTGPSGTRYHFNAEGSIEGDVFFRPQGDDAMIPMRDIIWLAALHKRSHLTSLAEGASDFKILGLPDEETS